MNMLLTARDITNHRRVLVLCFNNSFVPNLLKIAKCLRGEPRFTQYHLMEVSPQCSSTYLFVIFLFLFFLVLKFTKTQRWDLKDGRFTKQIVQVVCEIFESHFFIRFHEAGM